MKITNRHKKLVKAILGESFEIFLANADIISSSDLSESFSTIPIGGMIDISPGPPMTQCQWLISEEIDPPCDYPSDVWLRGYDLSIIYHYRPDVMFESYYTMIHDKKYDKLHYHRHFTRIVVEAEGIRTPHLVEGDDEEIKCLSVARANY